MINFDDIIRETIKEHNPNRLQIPDMDNAYENLKKNNRKKEHKIMIEFDDINADSLSNNRTLTDSNIIILLIVF